MLPSWGLQIENKMQTYIFKFYFEFWNHVFKYLVMVGTAETSSIYWRNLRNVLWLKAARMSVLIIIVKIITYGVKHLYYYRFVFAYYPFTTTGWNTQKLLILLISKVGVFLEKQKIAEGLKMPEIFIRPKF
jgi:hypothetical protein